MTLAEQTEKIPVPPRWLAFWLACLPAALLASPVALLGVLYSRALPRWAASVLGLYALSQLLPAAFAPEPLLALSGALLRTALLLGLLSVGAVMRHTGRLWPLTVGLAAVYLTALGFNFSSGGLDIFVGRLGHPYMTPITLGLAGALGVWLALFLKGHWGWRLPFGLTALAVLVFSGSRGPLMAMLVGTLAAFALQRRRQGLLILLFAGLLVGASVTIGERLGINLLSRLTQTDTSGRDVVWSNTLSVIRAHPVTGVGSYRLGAALTPPGEPCALFESPRPQARPPTCPAWLIKLGNPWLIAHNIALQQLAETGPLGLLGLMMLLSTLTVVSVAGRDPLAVAVVTGLLVATVNDNTLLVPSPFFAEVFWLIAGTQLTALRRPSFGWKAGLFGVGLTLLLCAPLWISRVLPAPQRAAGGWQLRYFNAPATVHSADAYPVYVQFALPDGNYRAVLKSCQPSCVTLQMALFNVQAGQSDLLTLQSKLGASGKKQLVLQVLPGQATFKFAVLAEKTWAVEVQP